MDSSAVTVQQLNPSRPKAKSKSKKKKSPPKTRKGRFWGPFQSVLKERSVAFNLTLDVQNLQQQIRDLTTLRDVLSTRTTLRRHSPEGSLFHVVTQYLQVFRSGWAVQEAGRKRLSEDQDQRAFLHSVMDPQVDVGNGLRGPDVMAEQIILYSTFIRFIHVSLTAYDIVVAEDAVIIKAQTKLRFQVLRKTIEMIFPHVIGDECLVAQLVGQEVEPSTGITFSFNEQGKCCKYELEVDFVEAFASIVKDPRKLDLLLGRALIADNCMFGLIDEPLENSMPGNALEDEKYRLEELNDLQRLPSDAGRILVGRKQFNTRHHEHDRFYRIINDYYFVFAKGYQRRSGFGQADFIVQAFVPGGAHDQPNCGDYVFQRWQALSESFGVLEFRQTSMMPIQFNDREEMCTVRSMASYTLRITPSTLQSVFPHVLHHKQLVDALIGNILVVPSQLVFSIEMDTGRISRMVERMDFVAALAPIVQSREELSFVMSQALLSLDGVSCHSPTAVCASLPPLIHQEKAWENAKGDGSPEKRASSSRRMNMADILTP